MSLQYIALAAVVAAILVAALVARWRSRRPVAQPPSLPPRDSHIATAVEIVIERQHRLEDSGPPWHFKHRRRRMRAEIAREATQRGVTLSVDELEELVKEFVWQ